MVNGKNIFILAGEDESSATIIAGTRSNEVRVTCDNIEVSSPTSGQWREYLAGRSGWTVSTGFLVGDASRIKDLLKVRKHYYLVFASKIEDTTTIELKGVAILTECQITATIGNLVQGSFRFVGTGAVVDPNDNSSPDLPNIPSAPIIPPSSGDGECSPYAVDFGEEIASVNSVYIDNLRKSIDIYNDAVENGVSDTNKYDLMFIPPNFSAKYFVDWRRLVVIDKPDVDLFYTSTVSPILRCYSLDYLRCGFDSSLKNNGELNCKTIRHVEILRHSLTNMTGFASYCRNIEKFIIDTSGVEIFNTAFREAKIPELHVDLMSATSLLNTFYNTTFDKLYIKNLGMSLSLKVASSSVNPEQVKYILDNCQQKSVSYTLTLKDADKAAFIEECNVDAEYATSLANANSKGLTLA
jgi:predicted secreted protein